MQYGRVHSGWDVLRIDVIGAILEGKGEARAKSDTDQFRKSLIAFYVKIRRRMWTREVACEGANDGISVHHWDGKASPDRRIDRTGATV